MASMLSFNIHYLPIYVFFLFSSPHSFASPLEKRQASPVTSTVLSITPSRVVSQPESDIVLAISVPTHSTSDAALASLISHSEGPKPTSQAALETSHVINQSDNSLFPQCRDPKAKPFCAPVNGTEVFVGDTYYVTWNTEFFTSLPGNSTITVELNYASNTSSTSPNVEQRPNNLTLEAWHSSRVSPTLGYVTVKMEEDFLRSERSVNLTFFVVYLPSSSSQLSKAQYFDGPTVFLSKKPVHHLLPPPPTPPPNKLGLAIGLPLALIFVVLVLIGMLVKMRRFRKAVGGVVVSSTFSRRAKKRRILRLGDCGFKRARNDRLGVDKSETIRMLGMEKEQDEILEQEYKDYGNGHDPSTERPVSLETLVITPVEEHFEHRMRER